MGLWGVDKGSLVDEKFSKLGFLLGLFFFIRVPYYSGGLYINRDPHLENYPYSPLIVPL